MYSSFFDREKMIIETNICKWAREVQQFVRICESIKTRVIEEEEEKEKEKGKEKDKVGTEIEGSCPKWEE